MEENLHNNNSSEEETVDYVDLLITKMLEMSDLIVYMAMTSITLVVFLLANSCINRNRREKPLIYKVSKRLLNFDLLFCFPIEIFMVFVVEIFWIFFVVQKTGWA